jgi:hypothetical protein
VTELETMGSAAAEGTLQVFEPSERSKSDDTEGGERNDPALTGIVVERDFEREPVALMEVEALA